MRAVSSRATLSFFIASRCMLVLVLAVPILLAGCVDQIHTTQGDEVIMTEEEIVNYNAEVIMQEYKESGFSPKARSLEGSSRTVASSFLQASNQTISTIESKIFQSGSIQLTATDAEGSTFVLFINRHGDCNGIEDSNGNSIFRVIE